VKFREAEIPDVFLVEPEPHADERGFFARMICPDEYAAVGIRFKPVQVNLSRNPVLHTLRGMHFQDAPYAEAKVVHVTRGSIYDVVVDLRHARPTFGRWAAFELDAEGARSLYVPEGFAHGFLTLQPNTDVFYHISRVFVPGQARGYRWNDPVLSITWPAQPKCVAPADEAWPNFPKAVSGSL
jgi:dTDP-4-dehydrorhamnose 3,5-epimerase